MIYLLVNSDQRRELEKLYRGEKVQHSFLKLVSFIIQNFLIRLFTWIKLKLNFKIVKSKSFFGFCHLDENNHWIGVVSDCCYNNVDYCLFNIYDKTKTVFLL